MKKNLPAILISIFTVVVLAVIVVIAIKAPNTNSSTSGETSNTSGLKVGTAAPDFSLPDLSNKSYTLSSYKGKSPVFVEFFAVWCPHCQRETAVINDLESSYGNKMQFLDVQASSYGRNAESGDTTPATINDLTWFRDTFHVTVPILKDQSIKTANTYGVQGFPTFYIIDKDGKITYTDSGEITKDTLAAQIQKVIQ